MVLQDGVSPRDAGLIANAGDKMFDPVVPRRPRTPEEPPIVELIVEEEESLQSEAEDSFLSQLSIETVDRVVRKVRVSIAVDGERTEDGTLRPVSMQGRPGTGVAGHFRPGTAALRHRPFLPALGVTHEAAEANARRAATPGVRDPRKAARVPLPNARESNFLMSVPEGATWKWLALAAGHRYAAMGGSSNQRRQRETLTAAVPGGNFQAVNVSIQGPGEQSDFQHPEELVWDTPEFGWQEEHDLLPLDMSGAMADSNNLDDERMGMGMGAGMGIAAGAGMGMGMGGGIPNVWVTLARRIPVTRPNQPPDLTLPRWATIAYSVSAHQTLKRNEALAIERRLQAEINQKQEEEQRKQSLAWKDNKLSRIRTVLLHQLPVQADHLEGALDAKGRSASEAAEVLRRKNDNMVYRATWMIHPDDDRKLVAEMLSEHLPQLVEVFRTYSGIEDSDARTMDFNEFMCFVEDSGALNDGLIKFAKSLFLRSNIDNDGWKDFPQARPILSPKKKSAVSGTPEPTKKGKGKGKAELSPSRRSSVGNRASSLHKAASSPLFDGVIPPNHHSPLRSIAFMASGRHFRNAPGGDGDGVGEVGDGLAGTKGPESSTPGKPGSPSRSPSRRKLLRQPTRTHRSIDESAALHVQQLETRTIDEALSIAEFVHIVWRLASLKFTNQDGDMGGHSFSVVEGHANDNLSDALSKFIAESIQPLIQRTSIAAMVKNTLLSDQTLFYLTDQLDLLEAIFNHYAALDGQGTTLALNEFCYMVKTTQMLSLKEAKMIFATSQAEDVDEASGGGVEGLPSINEMDLGEFIESLARVAAWKWHDEVGSSLFEKFARLVGQLQALWSKTDGKGFPEEGTAAGLLRR